MVPEADPARFLATDQDITALHEGRDVLEADRGHVEREPEPRAHPVDLDAHGKALDDLTAPAAHLDEVPREERQHGVRRHVAAVRGHHAEAVAVAVHREPEVGARAPDRLGEGVHVGRDGLRMDPSEEGIGLGAQGLHLAPRRRDERAEELAGGPVHGVGDDLQGPLGAEPGLDTAADPLEVGRHEVPDLDQGPGRPVGASRGRPAEGSLDPRRELG